MPSPNEASARIRSLARAGTSHASHRPLRRPIDERRQQQPDSDWRAVLARPLTSPPLPSIVELDVGARSDCGKIQPHNTDHYLAIRLGRVQQTIVTSLAATDLPADFEENGYGLLVADGIGEQSAGIQASRVALSAVAHLAIQFGRWNVRGSDSPRGHDRAG